MLLENGAPVRLGHRALDILRLLVEHAGDLVTKQQLMSRVWPQTFVDEGNLKVHVAALRKALRDGQGGTRYIVNIPGRGYKFVAPVSISHEPEEPRRTATTPNNLPVQLAHVVGRSETVAAIVDLLAVERSVTIAGAGGIGKTTVAVAAAGRLLSRYPDGIWFVDLAPISSPHLVPTALAEVLGLPIRSESPTPQLVASLRDKAMLIVLDSCEHLVDAAASLAEELVRSTCVSVLATSREPLRTEGEHVLRLPSLAVPETIDDLSVAEALGYSAVQLFVDRAIACLDTFELTDHDAPIVAAICRRLDGIALAIEMAAGCVDSFSVADIARLLDDRFHLLTRGRRTALPRHQTLKATLDWSYGLLSDTERVILRRLGIFAGWFTAAAAAEVLPRDGIGAAGISDAIANLASKSLLGVDIGDRATRYRLFDTARAYALEKLADMGETDETARAHACYCRDVFTAAERDWNSRPTDEWRTTYRPLIDDLRAALDWAFTPAGDVGIGVELTVAAVPLWLELSLMEECRVRADRGLTALDQSDPDSREAMQLSAAIAWSQMYTATGTRQTSAMWARALALADRFQDSDYRLRALWGLWADAKNKGRFQDAVVTAERFSKLAAAGGQTADMLVGERMIGDSLHFLGEQAAARRHIETMLARYHAPPHRSNLVRFQFDQEITARMTLSRVLWLRGLPDQAMRMATENVDRAVRLGHTLSLCNALAQSACPIVLIVGDLQTARRYTALLADLTTRDALHVWRAYATCFEGDILLRSGDLAGGTDLLQTGVDTLRSATFVQYLTSFLGQLADGCGRAGRLGEARALIDEALARCDASDEKWCVAELLRIRGEIARLDPDAGPAEAETWFRRSLSMAQAQNAIAWELRTATSLARLGRDRDGGGEELAALASVLARFREGHATADLVAARSVLTPPA
ncbi:ATP-binding protein [Rhodoplanes roseus]|uniref:ATP-binding protein n=1 Tax=Rhodoplanes roseus TaxID=29409 RepID=UPI001475A055|nr:winged helix-turn-helix domain-containing protein [Rhodoplanes roseus]